MGRTKGSKNGVRKVPIRKFKIRNYPHEDDTDTENNDPNRPTFNPNVLNAYKNKRYGKCIELIEKILNNNSEGYNEHYKILMAASMIMLKSQINRAHLILDEVLNAHPQNTDALYVRGVAFYFEGNLDLSMETFDKALEHNSGPDMDRARDMKAKIDMERRKAVIFVDKIESDQSEKPKIDQVIGLEGSQPTSTQEVPQVTEQNSNLSETETLKMSTPSSPEETKSSPSKPPLPVIPESLPKSFKPQTAEEFYQKGMELYMCGSLKKSLKMFDKSTEIDPNLAKSEDVGAKVQEILELMDTASINMEMKNYRAVVEIMNEALEVDETNLFVNRQFYFQRGLALFHMGENELSLKDYAKYDKINKMLNED